MQVIIASGHQSLPDKSHSSVKLISTLETSSSQRSYEETEHDQATILNGKENSETTKIKQHNSFDHLSIIGSASKLARGKTG